LYKPNIQAIVAHAFSNQLASFQFSDNVFPFNHCISNQLNNFSIQLVVSSIPTTFNLVANSI
jgi:hypothetical protein